MTHRAKVAEVACPEAIIDTDNWPITNKSDWRDYTVVQPKLGVPSRTQAAIYAVQIGLVASAPVEPPR